MVVLFPGACGGLDAEDFVTAAVEVLPEVFDVFFEEPIKPLELVEEQEELGSIPLRTR